MLLKNTKNQYLIPQATYFSSLFSFVTTPDTPGMETVFTLDRRNFTTYRYGRNRSFQILP